MIIRNIDDYIRVINTQKISIICFKREHKLYKEIMSKSKRVFK